MSDDETERSESGAPIYRHQPRDREWTIPRHFGQFLEEIEAHAEKGWFDKGWFR